MSDNKIAYHLGDIGFTSTIPLDDIMVCAKALVKEHQIPIAVFYEKCLFFVVTKTGIIQPTFKPTYMNEDVC